MRLILSLMGAMMFIFTQDAFVYAQNTASLAQTSDLAQFRKHRAEGIAFLDADNSQEASLSFSKAQAIIDDSPSILLLSAQANIAQNDLDAARLNLLQYLERGFVVDGENNPDIATLMDDQSAQKNKDNQAPFGKITPFITLEGQHNAISLAFGNKGSVGFLSTLKSSKILKLNKTEVTDFLIVDQGFNALALAQKDADLWVAYSPNDLAQTPHAQEAYLAQYSIETGALLQKISEPARPNRRINMIYAGTNGIFLCDQRFGEILFHAYGTDTLVTIVPEGYFENPQSIVQTEDPNNIIISDFTSGLYLVSLNEGKLTRLMASSNTSLLGIGSLNLLGNSLIAIQDGFLPHRVLRLELSDDKRRVTEASVILRSTSRLKAPKQGLLIGSVLRLISISQNTLQTDTSLQALSLEPVVIADIDLN